MIIDDLLSARFTFCGPSSDWLCCAWNVDPSTDLYLVRDDDHHEHYYLIQQVGGERKHRRQLAEFDSDIEVIEHFNLLNLSTCTLQGKECYQCRGLIQYDEPIRNLPDLKKLICDECYSLSLKHHAECDTGFIDHLYSYDRELKSISHLQELHTIAKKRGAYSTIITQIEQEIARKTRATLEPQ